MAPTLKPGIADVYLCDACGMFSFVKPERSAARREKGEQLYCSNCDEPMYLLEDQAVIRVQKRGWKGAQ